MIRIAGGLVMTADGVVEADVWVEGPTISAIGGTMGGGADLVIDATGRLVGPGFVDLHVHLRDPGETWKEDIASGTEAAVAGGYTALVAMPNTSPAVDTPEMVASLEASVARSGLCEIRLAVAMTVGRKGEEMVDMPALHGMGVRLFTDDGDCVIDETVMRAVMTEAARLPGSVIAQHAEDPGLSAGGHIHTGQVSAATGIEGIPPDAEWSVVERDLMLAQETGAHYHAQHLSTVRAVELIRQAKTTGIRVSAEVTPHHLTFDESSLSTLDPNLKMYPPLRSTADRQALIDGLVDGTIDAVATDHAPHSVADKAVGFVDAPRGVIGLETAAAVVWGVLGDPVRFFEVMSVRPAAIAGIGRHGVTLSAGSPANLVVFDPDLVWVPTAFRSKSSNSPYLGSTLKGRSVATLIEGSVVFEEAV